MANPQCEEDCESGGGESDQHHCLHLAFFSPVPIVDEEFCFYGSVGHWVAELFHYVACFEKIVCIFVPGDPTVG